MNRRENMQEGYQPRVLKSGPETTRGYQPKALPRSGQAPTGAKPSIKSPSSSK